jgi:hypothetical protein
MKRILLILIAAFLCGPALADEMVARNGKDSVSLQQAACPAAVLAHIPPTSRDRFQAASAVVDDRSYVACWALRPDGLVILVYEDGDGGLIPATDFRRSPGV